MMWNVYRRGKLVDSVWYTKDCDVEYVRQSLINHDGYQPDIHVRRA